MASIVQTVKTNGSGDYTDLVTGVSGILASGLAATGEFTEFELQVYSGYFTGHFAADVPYSGRLYINGQETFWFEPDGVNYIGGDSSTTEISNARIIGTGLTADAFSIASSSSTKFSEVSFIEMAQGITSSGLLDISSSSATGGSSTTFVSAPSGQVTVSDTDIAGFDTAISGRYIFIYDSNIIDCTHGIKSNMSVDISTTLVAASSGIVMSTGDFNGSYITMDTNWACLTLADTTMTLERSILDTNDTYSVTGSNVSGTITDTCFANGSFNPALDISGVDTFNSDPKFNDTTIYDYRLVLKDTTGSPCINVIDESNLHSSVTVTTEEAHLKFKDDKGYVNPQVFNTFVYKQGATLLFSDYMKESIFAERYSVYDIKEYELHTKLDFTANNIRLQKSIGAEGALHPWDWDIEKFETTEITDEHQYIIPRSVIDVSKAISGYVGDYFSSVIFGQMDKRSITPYVQRDLRGICYDFDESTQRTPVVWIIDGTTQSLSKLAPFTGETLEYYPLLTHTEHNKKFIYPSGLIAAGVSGDKYKYVLESNPQVEYLSDSDNGGFKWLPTDMNIKIDMRGILAYKGNLLITASEYSNNIESRDVTPTGTANGLLLKYSNNDTFEHYIAEIGDNGGPISMPLASVNSYPTDITIYEDGNLFVADYVDTYNLYRYKLAYDYALLQSSYDNETLVLLRENYENVEL